MLSIEKEYRDIVKLIAELKAILNSPARLRGVIRKELSEIRDKYSVPRRTEMLKAEHEITIDKSELIVVEDVAVVLLPGLRIKRVPERLYSREQAEQEKPLAVLHTETDKKIRLFTNLGCEYTLNSEDIQETRNGARPQSLSALLTLEEKESVVAAFNDSDEGELLFYTKNGMVKRTASAEYNTRIKRVQAINLKEGDEVLSVEKVYGDSVLIVTLKGMSIRFSLEEVPATGRVSSGVMGIKLEKGDFAVFAHQVLDEGEILLISDRGYAKRSLVFDYEVQKRYGKGLKTFDFKKNGSNGTCVAAAFYVREPFDFFVTQKHGTETKFNTEEILIEQRAGKGTLLVMALLDDVVTGAYSFSGIDPAGRLPAPLKE
jgi:DNA gyrase/topoisomerase IV subunit A